MGAGAIAAVVLAAGIASAFGSGVWVLVSGECVVVVVLSLRCCRVKYCARSVGAGIKVVGVGWLQSGLSWK